MVNWFWSLKLPTRVSVHWHIYFHLHIFSFDLWLHWTNLQHTLFVSMQRTRKVWLIVSRNKGESRFSDTWYTRWTLQRKLGQKKGSSSRLQRFCKLVYRHDCTIRFSSERVNDVNFWYLLTNTKASEWEVFKTDPMIRYLPDHRTGPDLTTLQNEFKIM